MVSLDCGRCPSAKALLRHQAALCGSPVPRVRPEGSVVTVAICPSSASSLKWLGQTSSRTGTGDVPQRHGSSPVVGGAQTSTSSHLEQLSPKVCGGLRRRKGTLLFSCFLWLFSLTPVTDLPGNSETQAHVHRYFSDAWRVFDVQNGEACKQSKWSHLSCPNKKGGK